MKSKTSREASLLNLHCIDWNKALIVYILVSLLCGTVDIQTLSNSESKYFCQLTSSPGDPVERWFRRQILLCTLKHPHHRWLYGAFRLCTHYRFLLRLNKQKTPLLH
jgi:hypothetical protein